METTGLWVNDVHSGLNLTHQSQIQTPHSISELRKILQECQKNEVEVIVSGCRHAMGGQQFSTNGCLIDLREMRRVLNFDSEKGLMRVEAGIQWEELIKSYQNLQGPEAYWGIAQKQTGADNFTLGGSLGANVHGRGLKFGPIIQDVEAIVLINSDGVIIPCSRQENSALFHLAIGGYGLFGIIIEVTLRLVPRQRLERLVEVIPAGDLVIRLPERIAQGCIYGDFQFSIDEKSPNFLQIGVFSCYRPTQRPLDNASLHTFQTKDWLDLLSLACTNRAAAFATYTKYYLNTHEQVYWSDTHQLSTYLPDYAGQIKEIGATNPPSSLVITELYVPRDELPQFLRDAAATLRSHSAVVIYGTVRWIEADRESFLPWARESFTCVIFNLLVQHSPDGLERAEVTFRALIDLAIHFRGSFYLTYHRYATRHQIEKCYPQFGDFLRRKKEWDPQGRFVSDWYRHYRNLWSGSIS